MKIRATRRDVRTGTYFILGRTNPSEAAPIPSHGPRAHTTCDGQVLVLLVLAAS